MPYAIVWFVVASLWALWSLAAWALHAIAAWTLTHAGSLGDAATGISGPVLPEWLARWTPPEVTAWLGGLFANVEPIVRGLLQAAPAWADAITLATVIVWGLGCAFLVAAGIATLALVALWRRRRRRTLTTPRPPGRLTAG